MSAGKRVIKAGEGTVRADEGTITYETDLNEYELRRTHWIAWYVNGDNVG